MQNQFRWELRKLFAQRAAWLGFAAVAGFQVIFFLLIKVPSVRPALNGFFSRYGYAFSDGFSGLTVAGMIVGEAVGMIGSIFIAVVVAQSVAREVDHGTIRLVLCRPVSRLRVWSLKLAACSFYAMALIVFASVLAMVLGIALEGWGPMVVHVNESAVRVAYAPADGLRLYAWAMLFHFAGVFTLVALAFAITCFGARGATASVGTLAYLFGENFLRMMPFLASVRPYFLMSRMTSWNRVFEPRENWAFLWEIYWPLLAFDAVLLGASLAVFLRRDFKP